VEADTSEVPKADYETEIRSFMKERYGDETYDRIFPPQHTQSRVMRRYRI
jgi:predicted subunit of tRNA(5-methylaminomethyl-2-thiouridylate) methyltransferase